MSWNLFWNFIDATYWGGLIQIGIGSLIVWHLYKAANKSVRPWSVGIALLLMGIAVIIAKLVGKI